MLPPVQSNRGFGGAFFELSATQAWVVVDWYLGDW